MGKNVKIRIAIGEKKGAGKRMEWSIHFSVAWLSTVRRASVGTHGFFSSIKAEKKIKRTRMLLDDANSAPSLHIIEKRTRLLPSLSQLLIHELKTLKTKLILLCKNQGCRSRLYIFSQFPFRFSTSVA
jgi:hypothetical protein